MNPKLNLVSRSALLAALVMSPLLLAAKGQGCAPAESDPDSGAQTSPNVSGEWSLAWEDNLDVEITIGGAVYHESIGAQGGAVEIEHDGNPIVFDLDCSRPEVVCPSEVWPTSVTLEQRDAFFPRNVYVTIPFSECTGELVEPDASECGAGTNNEDCAEVCDGEIAQVDKETFGFLSADGSQLGILLGGSVASNGVNCAMLGLSVADAQVETTGEGALGDWEAVSLPSAEVVTAYAGGCLWGGDVDDDGTIEALVVGATVKLTTNFTGERQ